MHTHRKTILTYVLALGIGLFLLQAAAGETAVIGTDDISPDLQIQWTKKSPMPGYLYAFDAVTLGNKIYAVGGRGLEEGYNRYLYVYDLDKDAWETKKELLFSRSNHAVVALNGKIYVFGGNENPGKVEVYDPGSDSWQELADMPTPRQHINYSGIAVNGKIHVIGGIVREGEKGFSISDKHEVYNPTTDTWTERAPLPAQRQNAAVVNFQDLIYVISGTDGEFVDQPTVFVYDPGADSWKTRAPFPEPKFINGTAVVDDKILVLTGATQEDTVCKIFAYDPASNRWQNLAELPESFMLAGVTSAGDRLYVLGGHNLTRIQPTCWEAALRQK